MMALGHQTQSLSTYLARNLLLQYNKQVQPIKTHLPEKDINHLAPKAVDRTALPATINCSLIPHSNTLAAQHSQHPVLSKCSATADDISPRAFRGLSGAPGCIGKGTHQPLRKASVPIVPE